MANRILHRIRAACTPGRPASGVRAAAPSAIAISVGVVLIGALFMPASQATWTVRYDGGQNGRDGWFATIAPDTAGVLVVGTSQGSTGLDVVVGRFASSGSQQWITRVDGPNLLDDHAFDSFYGFGNIYVTGATFDSTGQSNSLLLRVSPTTGAVLWQRQYDGVAGLADYGQAVVTGSPIEVFLAGTTTGPSTNHDWLIQRYLSGSGGLSWTRTFDGPQHANDQVVAMLYRTAIGVVAVGVVGDSLGYGDIGLRAYSSAGAVQWSTIYNGPASLADWPTGMAQDASGNIYVSGFSGGVGTQGDWLLLKYSSGGGLLWERRRDSGAGWDGASSLAIGPASEIYVAGVMATSDSTSDYGVAAYASNGDLLWATTFAGAGSGTDETTSVVVGSSGAVYVTGTAQQSSPVDRDITTVRLNAATGSVTGVWLTVGAVGDRNVGTDITVDAAGKVYVVGVGTDSGGDPDAVLQRLDGAGVVDVGPEDQIDRPLSLAFFARNPARDRMQLQVQLPASARLSASLIDVAGRVRARMFEDQSLAAGNHEFTTSIRDLARGVYLLHVNGTMGSRPIRWTQKIVLTP